jgi:hypothetical protein
MEITSFSYSKYIVGSSLLFQIPAYYAYQKNIYSVAASCCITSLLSINYWRHSCYSWRRTMDIYWARTAGIYYFLWGYQHAPCKITYINHTCVMIWFYYEACRQFHINPLGNWYIYYMTFHAIAALNQFIAIYNIP